MAAELSGGPAAGTNMLVGGAVGSGMAQAMFVGTATGLVLAPFLIQRVTDGTTAAALTVTLPLNALVRKFEVVVQAKQADFTSARNVAQVRDANQEVLGGDGMAVVLDFGLLRTVAAVQVPLDLQVMSVTPWTGMGFAPNPIYSTTAAGSIQPPSTAQIAYFGETRTERLLLRLIGTMDLDELAAEDAFAVLLPEPPSGLELRLEGGAPAWSHPAPPQLTDAAELSATAWNRDGRRLVDVAAALAAVTGDPTRAQPVDFTLTLTSRVPGDLALTEHARQVSVIRRVLFDGAPERTLDFAAEGAVDLPLSLPAPPAGQSRAIEAVRFTAIAALPEERVLPPVGPDPAGGDGVPVLADLALGADRAACVRLRADTGLAELTGVRLPLKAGGDGAEARIVLWRNKGPGTAEPVEALPDATSDPVTLQGGAAEVWTSFLFPHPVPLDDADPPWAALLVSRGAVTWSMGAAAGPDDPLAENLVRLGPPTGPWKPLPAPFRTGDGPLTRLRGRVRAMGLAPKDAPLAPLLVGAAGAAGAPVAVTPTAKGALIAVAFEPPLPAAQPVLRLTALTGGAITLRDVDVVSTN